MPKGIPNVKKAAVKPVPTNAADLLERFKDYPAIDVISRRFKDPNDPGSLPILLKDESQHACMNSDHQRQLKPGTTKCHQCGKPARKWHIHTCNTAIEGRWAQMKNKGYIPVRISDLQDSEDVSDLVRQQEDDGEMYVRRGDRGKEITMKQPLEIYNHIKRLQREALERRSRSKRAQREDLAEAISANTDLGSERDEAASMVQRGGIAIESMTRERTTLGEEAGTD